MYFSQKKRKLGDERRLAAKAETTKLLESNVVLVKKASGKWRMCVDYTNLNKACPKDAYPESSIDRLVDDAARNRVLSLVDAYSRYNQIPMAPFDKTKNVFITDDANYFYKVMPFGLKRRCKLPKANG